MKRKLFILLLAIGALTAFQTSAQAQTKVRILADTSGLAKTSHFGNDSFPHVKKAELFNWLSFISGETKLKTGSRTDSLSVQDSILIQKELWGDAGSVFKVNFFGGDSTKFQIIPKETNDPVELRHAKGSTNLFSILKLRTTDWAGTKSDGLLANFPPKWPEPDGGSWKGDTIAGYLAYVPDANKETTYQLDTLLPTIALVGVDKKGDLSLKYFNEFAFYADTLPLLLQSFQFVSEDSKVYPGRLYRTDSFPYLQIHDKSGKELIYSSRNSTAKEAEGATGDSLRAVGKATDWGTKGAKQHELDGNVWSWLDIKLSGDTAIVLPGYKQVAPETGKLADSTIIVRLDTLFGRAHKVTADENKLKFDTAKWISPSGYLNPDSIKGYWEAEEENTDSVVYLKKEQRGNEDYLSFTVKLKNEKKESDWTNGYPTQFKFKERNVYYYVGDTTLMALLDSIYVDHFGHTTTVYNSDGENYTPYDSVGARYVYKNNDDSWRPLYVKVQHVDDSAEAVRKYEYAGTKWLIEKQLLGTRVTQEVDVTGLPGRRITDGHASGDAISLTEDEGASLVITLADTIGATTHRFGISDYSELSQGEFKNTDSVELFHITNGDGLYLTVAGKSSFTPPLKNTITWEDSIWDSTTF